jgi:SAM-dependent methyltransferase
VPPAYRGSAVRVARKKRSKKSKREPFDKYAYYIRAVQSPEVDCQFASDAYKESRGQRPRVLREDFCGTFGICCAWVRRHKLNKSIGIDLDAEPIAYGMQHYLSELREAQANRVLVKQASVFNARVPKADVTLALNFSFYLFKKRAELLQYFRRARQGLKPKGIFITDAFGGTDSQQNNMEHTKFKDFTYFWDQKSYDPITGEALFHIHFKRKGERPRLKVFTYDWRMWTIPEIREVMIEAGFKRTHVYWEGTTRSGTGNGVFKRSEVGEECDGWVAYVLGEA